MYEILFHILGLALLEIIFYFEYVGPMETKVFKDSINNAIKSITDKPSNEDKEKIRLYLHNDPLVSILFGNITDYQNNVDSDYNKSINNRNDYNNNLYNMCIKYWSISFLIITTLIFIYYFINYLLKINKLGCYKEKLEETSTQNNNEIEMATIHNDTLNVINYENLNSPTRRRLVRMRINSSSNDDITSISNENNQNKNTKLYKVFKYFIYYIFSFGGILAFEYIFFNNIVLKYKITSNIEIEYLIFKQLDYYIS